MMLRSVVRGRAIGRGLGPTQSSLTKVRLKTKRPVLFKLPELAAALSVVIGRAIGRDR
jgi:hypothetical protein